MNLPQLWATNAEVQALGWTLLHFVWQGMAVAAVLGLALDALRDRAASLRYTWCLASLVILVACPVVTYCAVRSEIGDSFVRRQQAFRAADLARMQNTLASLSTSELSQLVADLDRYVPAPPPMRGSRELAWVVIGWICGAAMLSARLLGGWFAAWRVAVRRSNKHDIRLAELSLRLSRKIGLTRIVPVATSSWINVPMVVGCLRPIILLPTSSLTGLSPAHLEALIVHEMAHLRRHDALVNAIQALVEIALFYHPAVWWISRQLRNEREAACDDLAAAVVGDRTVYARALATLEASRCTPVVLAANDGRLISRIRRLMGESDMSARSTAPALGVGIVAAALCVGSVQLQANAQGDKAKPAPKKTSKTVSKPGQDLIKYRDGVQLKPKTTDVGPPTAEVLYDKVPGADLAYKVPSPEIYERLDPFVQQGGNDDLRRRLEALEDMVRRLMARLESSDRGGARAGRAVNAPVAQAELSARRAELDAAEQRVAVQRAQEQNARAQVEAGIANIQSVQKARADLAQSEADRLNVIAQLRAAEAQNVLRSRSVDANRALDVLRQQNAELAAREVAVARSAERNANRVQAGRQSDELQDLRKVIEDLRRQNDELRRQLQQTRPRRSGLTPSPDPVAELPFTTPVPARGIFPADPVLLPSVTPVGILPPATPSRRGRVTPPPAVTIEPAIPGQATRIAPPAVLGQSVPSARVRRGSTPPVVVPGVAVPAAEPVIAPPAGVSVRTSRAAVAIPGQQVYVTRAPVAEPARAITSVPGGVTLADPARRTLPGGVTIVDQSGRAVRGGVTIADPAGRAPRTGVTIAAPMVRGVRTAVPRTLTTSPKANATQKNEAKPAADKHPDPDNWPFNRPD